MSKLPKTTTTTPADVAKIKAMREAGFTLASIAEESGLSVRQVSRYVQETPKGKATAAMVEKESKKLLETLSGDTTIKKLIATQLRDDITHAETIRTKALEILQEHLTPSNLEEAALSMRALAAYSTVLKNTSDVLHRYTKNYEEKEEKQLEGFEIVILNDEECRALAASKTNNVESFDVDIDVEGSAIE